MLKTSRSWPKASKWSETKSSGSRFSWRFKCFSHTLHSSFIFSFIFYPFDLSDTHLCRPFPSRYLAVHPGGARLRLRPGEPASEDQGQRGGDPELHEVLGQPHV